MSSPDTNSLLNLLQISDSAFPTGSFAHSAGLEAAYQRGFLTTSEKVEKFLLASTENVGSFSIPFVREAHQLWTDLEAIRALDRLLNASLSNHIANRGRSLIQTACATYKDVKLTEVQKWIYDGKLMGHQAVMYGLVCAFLGVPEDQAVMSFLFSSLRTTVAAAVRLGAVGTLEGQRMQFMLQSRIPEIIERHKHRTSDSAANVFPVVDVMQSSHDQLFARMFYS
uniref:Urease accessory protein uref posttranslational modification n=1 Tax=Rhipicephalus appendiculatus TaxID=34631 RepID=A0A131Y9M5_RHIAP